MNWKLTHVLKAAVIAAIICLGITSIGNPVQAEDVYIPDSNLKHILLEQSKLTPSDLAKIEKLDNKGKEVKDFSGLEYLTNLKELKIEGVRMTDLSFLAKVPTLTRLDLQDNKISNITPIANLSQLQYLNLQENQITDLSPLKGLTNLTELDLEFNQISDISQLSGLVKLRELDIQDNRVSDISPLSNLINLESLNLRNNEVTNTSALVTIDRAKNTGTGYFINLEENRLNLGSSAGADIKSILNNKRFIVRYEPQKVIQVKLNGNYLESDVPPTVIEGRTLVPLRAIFEALDAQISWDDKTKKVTGQKGSTTVVLTINKKTAQVNGVNTILDVPATIVDGRTMVPARFIAESLGQRVSWDEKLRTVVISK
ncbi:MAG: stalk domain-containing protein [Syntrophomonadaceae bacterium]|jgi:Leucine-rich repeat (LRR) protein